MSDSDRSFYIEQIPLSDDYEGAVIATLISSNKNRGGRTSILYLHGYIDYFFQTHLSEFFNAKGYDFHALDLRKYGRSLLPHQTPNYCRSIEEYYSEITEAIKMLQARGAQRIILLGHSTGGLIASCYMNDGPLKSQVSQLVLNSPFLDMALPKGAALIAFEVSNVLARISPYWSVNMGLSPLYAKTVHKDHYGEWDFNLQWKPIDGFPTYFSWFAAIVRGQRRLRKSNIKVPILLLHSQRSLQPKSYGPEVMRADIVLNVEDMKRIGPSLGPNVTMTEIVDGQHDLVLSHGRVRQQAMSHMASWLDINNDLADQSPRP